MKIVYTGKPAEFLPKDRLKLEGKLAKLTKVVERRGEKEAHVILSQVRHLHKAEITMNALDHALIGVGQNGDLVTAMSEAIENLEKQVLKLRTKRRDTHRHDHIKEMQPELRAPATAKPAKKSAQKVAVVAKAIKNTKQTEAKPPRPKVFRVDSNGGRKPMSLEEAVVEMSAADDYLVYRDSKTDKVCTLMRRPDGHLDLIES